MKIRNIVKLSSVKVTQKKYICTCSKCHRIISICTPYEVLLSFEFSSKKLGGHKEGHWEHMRRCGGIFLHMFGERSIVVIRYSGNNTHGFEDVMIKYE